MDIGFHTGITVRSLLQVLHMGSISVLSIFTVAHMNRGSLPSQWGMPTPNPVAAGQVDTCINTGREYPESLAQIEKNVSRTGSNAAKQRNIPSLAYSTL